MNEEVNAILNKYEKLIYKACWSFSNGTLDDVKELHQQVVTKLLEYYRKDNSRFDQTAYIYKIIYNTLIDNQRKEKTRNRIFSYFDNDLDVQQEETDIENELKLYELIKTLNNREKSIINLYLDRHSYKEIGNIVGISEQNVAVQMQRIKEKLRKTKIKMYGKD